MRIDETLAPGTITLDLASPGLAESSWNLVQGGRQLGALQQKTGSWRELFSTYFVIDIDGKAYRTLRSLNESPRLVNAAGNILAQEASGDMLEYGERRYRLRYAAGTTSLNGLEDAAGIQLLKLYGGRSESTTMTVDVLQPVELGLVGALIALAWMHG